MDHLIKMNSSESKIDSTSQQNPLAPFTLSIAPESNMTGKEKKSSQLSSLMTRDRSSHESSFPSSQIKRQTDFSSFV